MPLTAFQASVLAVLAPTRSDVSYFAGGAALHMGPSGERFSNDLDFFHSAADAANQTFAADALALRAAGYEVTVIAEYRGFVSAAARRNDEATVLDWAHESAWRFLPLVAMAGGGVMLHPIDLAINKLVALANRREPRDLVDAIFADTHILAFPALVWAVVEKNPGLNPSSYLELFRRRTLTPEDAAYLRFTGTYSVEAAARHFRRMVDAADAFIAANTHREPGALLQDRRTGSFFVPQSDDDWAHTRAHRGAMGGVIAQPAEMPIEQVNPPPFAFPAGALNRMLGEAIYTELRARSQIEQVSRMVLTMAASQLGRVDETIAYAIESVVCRDNTGPFRMRRPFFSEAVHAHPRYPELLRAIGL